MTLQPRQPAAKYPPFNNWQGLSTVAAIPPFDFDRVTLRYFPLKADLHALERFCDNYLNVCEDFAYFRPSMPFVLLCIVDYGKMSLAKGNVGWATQNELFFSVPVEWYEPQDGKLKFKDTGQVAPFIFVDNEASEAGGREVYGWPKVHGWLAPGINPWTRNPRNRRQLLKLRTNVVDKLFEGNRYVPADVLVLEEEPPASMSVWPTEFDNPLNPLVTIPNAVKNWSSFFASALEASAPPILGGPDDPMMSNQFAALTGQMDQFARELHGYTFNLKQIRDATDPDGACYQSLVAAKMEIRRFHRGGLLGEPAVLRGDTSGGVTINLRRYPTLPVIDTLGLEVESEFQDGEVPVASLKPVLPFWHEMDMRYQKGENLCWRSKDMVWGNTTSTSTLRNPFEKYSLYNTTGSSAFQVATGPFRFPDTLLRVLPLRISEKSECLQNICDAMLNCTGANTPYRYEPYGNQVYMVITSFNEMSAATDNLGLWADRQVDFLVPVKWLKGDDLVSLGVIAPFRFSNSDIATTTQREVSGWPTVTAEITSPGNEWLDNPLPDTDGYSRVLDVSTLVSAAVNVGQEAEWARLIEVYQKPRGRNEKKPTYKANKEHSGRWRRFGRRAKRMLKQGRRLNQISLKQFRDAELPRAACYQAQLRSSLIPEAVEKIIEYDGSMTVKVHRFPTQDIVATLGLEVEKMSVKTNSYYLKAERPFMARVSLLTEPADVLCSRIGTEDWVIPDDQPDLYFANGNDEADVAADLVKKFVPQDAINYLLNSGYPKPDGTEPR